MKTRNYLLLVTVAVVAALNFSLSTSGKKLLSDLKLLTVEAIANAEYNPNQPTGNQRLKTYMCGVDTEVKVGEYPDGSPIIQTIQERGEEGKCLSGIYSCAPYKCVKLLYSSKF